MNHVLESDARLFFEHPLICEEYPDWRPSPGLKGEVATGAGLLDLRGVGLKLYADLIFRRSPKTYTARYIFSVFRRQLSGNERIYQLDVTQWAGPVKDVHQMPHEHMGTARYVGDDTWSG